jgi:hypothetical protein
MQTGRLAGNILGFIARDKRATVWTVSSQEQP